jgi:Tol biopolymer transport system component
MKQMGMMRTHAARLLFLPAMLAAAACGGDDGITPVEPVVYDLVYDTGEGIQTELYLIRAEGGAPQRLLPAGMQAFDPAPSPDGRRIAFVVRTIEGASDVWVVNRDGTGLLQLTTSPEPDDQPAWSPDGSRIAWRSLASEQQGDIWVMDADGTDKRRLTLDPTPATINDVRPAWSPDGTRIAYGSSANGDLDIWTMRASDGGDARRLTSGDASDADPAWSPNGAFIVFRRLRAGDSDLAVVAASGGAVSEFPRPKYQRHPAWSPDGAVIVFEEDAAPSDVTQLFALRLDGGAVTGITANPAWGGGQNAAFIRRPVN